VFWYSLQLLSETFLIVRRNERDIIISAHRSSSTRYSCQMLMKLDFFSTSFRKNTQISNYMKIRPVRAKLFHADGRMDGRTDRYDEANGLFPQFCEWAWETSSNSKMKYFILRYIIIVIVIVIIMYCDNNCNEKYWSIVGRNLSGPPGVPDYWRTTVILTAGENDI